MKRLNIICAAIALLAVLGCAAYVVRNYMNRDTTPPVLTVEEDTIECSIDATQQELLQGLSASDDKDGDLTSQIMVNSITIQDDSDADQKTFDIDYVVFDSANNATAASRTLIYTDYHSPHFAISDELRFDSISEVDLYSLITAEDCIDGDVSSQITIEMDDAYLNAISYGVYDCTVSVTNSLGDTASLPLSFEIYDATSEDESSRPDIGLKDYLVYLKQGDKFDPESELDGVVIDKIGYWLVDRSELFDETTQEAYFGYTNANYAYFMLKDAVDIDSNLDTDTPGTYEITYSMRHPEEGTLGTTTLLVVVE